MASSGVAVRLLSPSTETAYSRHQCRTCSRTFKRPEHLTRHQRSHQQQNRVSCSICSKTFSRSDIRNRHEALHQLDQQQANSGRRRACLECARVRGRCNKTDPCQRCRLKSLECVYPMEEVAQQRQQLAIPLTEDNAGLPEISPSSMFPDDEPHGPVLSARGMPDAPPYLDHPGNVMVMQQEEVFDSGNGGFAANASTYPGDMGDDAVFQLPINWLHPDYNMDVDYTSIFGLTTGVNGFGSAQDFSSFEGAFSGESGSVPLLPPPISPNTQQGPSRVSQQEPRADNIHHSASPQIIQTSAASPFTDTPTPGSTISLPGGASTASRLSIESHSPRLLARGGIYATSTNGSRIPCTARRKKKQTHLLGSIPLRPVATDTTAFHDGQDGLSLQFSDLGDLSCPPVEESLRPHTIRPETHDVMIAHFQRLCLNSHSNYPAYVTETFPNVNFMNLFIHLYFENFDPILPIYNEKVANFNDNWILTLAIAALGSQYTETEQVSQWVVPFHEFLRRAITSELEMGGDALQSLPLVQAMVLSQVAMMYHGSRRLRFISKSQRGILIDALPTLSPLNPKEPDGMDSLNASSGRFSEADWQEWLANEARRRLCYAIWLLDCMAAYHFELRPLFSLEFAQWELPHDELWAAQSTEEFAQKLKASTKNPSLESAVHKLFVAREVKPDLGEFGNLLVLHGVYQEVFKVKSYLDRTLSGWVPSIPQLNGQGAIETSNGKTPNRASQVTLASWRSAAMDCIDVLHWSANGVVAQLLGAEHATVLHLHFSRVVLFSPYDKIRALATSLASLVKSQGPQGQVSAISRDATLQLENEVLQWAQRDEHKARLAALHCGCFFWHVRRYSCNAFYEPTSVFLATLVLWAYSSYACRAPLPNSTTADENDADSPPDPTFIHLDRPCDDEMVQLFVRSGRPSVIRAYVAGVGDIYDAKGPQGILREGRKLLASLSMAWGRTSEYFRVLEGTEAFIVQNRPQTHV